MSTPQPATKFQKLLVLGLSMAFLSSVIYSPKAPQTEPRVEARQAQIQDLSKYQIGYLDSEIYQNGLAKIELKTTSSESSQSSKTTELDAKIEIAKIEKYRQTFFPNSPIPAEMIYKNSVKSGIPVSFFLAACHNESHCGTKGRAVQTRNVNNIGNFDCGDYKPVAKDSCNNFLENWEKGLELFAKLISECYFNEGEIIKLETWISRDFRAVRCNIKGKRYMTSPLAHTLYKERVYDLKSFKIN